MTARAAVRQTVALCLLAVIVAAFAVETTLRNRAATPGPGRVQTGADARATLKALRAKGDHAYVSLLHADITRPGPDGTLQTVLKIADGPVLPLGGVANATTILCNETGRWITYRADRYGFRNPPGIWDRPITLAMIGDSYTQGNCVAEGDHFVDRLRDATPGLLNLGQRGDGPFAELGAIREYLAAVKPKRVLWFYYEGNDVPGDMLREMRTPALRRYLAADYTQNLMARAPAVSAAFAAYIDKRLGEAPKHPAARHAPERSLWDALRSFLLLYRTRSALGIADYPSKTTSTALRRVLAAARDAVAAWGGELALVYLPAKRRFLSAGARRELDHYRAVARATTRQLDIPMLDMTDRFARAADPAALYREHFTEAGHALVAAEVRRFLRRLERPARP